MHKKSQTFSSTTQRWFALFSFVLATAFIALPAQSQYFNFGKNKVQYESLEWFYVQSTHFDVYYYEPGGRYLAEFSARAAEEAYLQLSELYQHEISDRIPILVFQNASDFAVNNAVNLPLNAESIGGVTELYKNRIAVPFTGDYRSYRHTLHHELSHAVLNDIFYGGSIQSVIQNNIQLQIPLWFNEGIAEYSSEGFSSEDDMHVRDAIINGYLPPVPYLNNWFAYPGGQSLWDYIAEQYGREKIAEIFSRIQLSRSLEQSFQNAIGLTLDELSERWQASLKKVHWPEIAAREDIDDFGTLLISREDGYFYNTSPSISPQGDLFAFITTEDGYFDVYLARTSDGEVVDKLVNGNDNTKFESLKLLDPTLTWSPDGSKIAMSVKSGPSDAIAIIDVETKETKHYRVPGMDAIISLSWSPDGTQIVFEGSINQQSDILVLTIDTEETLNFTNDLFSDHDPSWSPDGKSIVFHSDRGDYLEMGQATIENFNMLTFDFSQYDIYRIEVGSNTLDRITNNQPWDEKRAKYGEDSNTLMFISDRNGVFNLYKKDLTTGVETPLTDVLTGITQFSLSKDGKKAVVQSLKEGTPSIYLLKAPFDRNVGVDELTPNVWAQRSMQQVTRQAPSLTLASEALLQRNPIMRDAVDGSIFDRRRVGQTESESTGDGEGDEWSIANDTDTTALGEARVDFRNYTFSDAFEEANDDPIEEEINLFDPEDNEDEDGNLKPKKYQINFSPDIIYGSAGYDAIFGVTGVTQMQFSDVLGDHKIGIATNLLLDLRNSDYFVSYNYLPNRIDWSFLGYHTARLLAGGTRRPDGTIQRTFFRYRYYGGGVSASFPLTKFTRLDFDLPVTVLNRTQLITGNSDISETRYFATPTVTYTKDVTLPGYLYPASGVRYALSLAGSPIAFGANGLQYGTVMGDFRWYQSIGGAYTFTVRGFGAASFGKNPQLFYTAGVQNWINRTIDGENGYPLQNVEDFALATPITPLRGQAINQKNGHYLGLVNVEFRFPLIAALLPGPIPFIALYNLQGVGFVDAGGVWGANGNDQFNVWGLDQNGDKRFADVAVGAGVGLRTILLGFPVRLDWAWPYDGKEWGDRQLYFSIGLDF